MSVVGPCCTPLDVFGHGMLTMGLAGRLLTIDYGARATTLYHRRPKGSLRAYLLEPGPKIGPSVQEPPR